MNLNASLAVRRILALIVTMLATVMLVSVSSPAQAAAGGTYCFRYSNGAAYGNQPIQVQVGTVSGWQTLVHGRTGLNGCGSFTIGTAYRNYYVRIYAQQNVVYNNRVLTIWSGTTPLWGNPGHAYVNLGTGTVSCTAVTMSC